MSLKFDLVKNPICCARDVSKAFETLCLDPPLFIDVDGIDKKKGSECFIVLRVEKKLFKGERKLRKEVGKREKRRLEEVKRSEGKKNMCTEERIKKG